MSRVPPLAPSHVTCNHCHRPKIVVDRRTGLRAPHNTEPKIPGARTRKTPCDGSGCHYTSMPDPASEAASG